MNQRQIESFLTQLTTLLNIADEVQQEIDKMHAFLKAAKATEDEKRAYDIAGQLEMAQEHFAKLEQGVLAHAQRPDLESAQNLALDLKARMDNVVALNETYRQQLARFELAVTTGDLTSEPTEEGNAASSTRAKYEAQLAASKARHEQAFKLLRDLTPSPTGLLSLV